MLKWEQHLIRKAYMATRIVFFDLETRKHAADLSPDNDLGWDKLRAGEGGASAIALYDTQTKWVHLYDDHSINAAARHLESADVVVGFCSQKFDVPVIEGILGRALRLRFHYDIYIEMVRGHAERNIRTHPGDLKLDTICKRNLGRGKIEHGANAKTLASQGRYGQLFNYCADDVHLTYDLFLQLIKDGGLINTNGKFMSLPLPSWIKLET